MFSFLIWELNVIRTNIYEKDETTYSFERLNVHSKPGREVKLEDFSDSFSLAFGFNGLPQSFDVFDNEYF